MTEDNDEKPKRATGRRFLKWLVIVVGGLIGCYLLVLIAGLVYDPLGLKGSSNGHFPNALHWASPDPWKGNTYLGYENTNAAALQAQGQGREFSAKLRFVPANESSTNNLTVSVNPIDHWTWSATALASNGCCYAMLISHDHRDPEMGSTYYAVLPQGAPCTATSATPDVVTSTTPPD